MGWTYRAHLRRGLVILTSAGAVFPLLGIGSRPIPREGYSKQPSCSQVQTLQAPLRMICLAQAATRMQALQVFAGVRTSKKAFNMSTRARKGLALLPPPLPSIVLDPQPLVDPQNGWAAAVAELRPIMERWCGEVLSIPA